MHALKFTSNKKIDWSKASKDYSQYRPGPPISFFNRLKRCGIGLKEQRILDLGTGTGVLALQFAKQGACVTGVDADQGQIIEATKNGQNDGLSIDFVCCAAEKTPFENHSFDVITANQCWIYLDKDAIVKEVQRLLTQQGVLVTSHFSYLASIDPLAKASETLVKKYNPDWDWGNWDGIVPEVPDWSRGICAVTKMFVYDEAIPFNREGWRGRMRAHRAIGAELSQDEVQAFDRDLTFLLENEFPEQFTVLHRIDAHIFTFNQHHGI